MPSFDRTFKHHVQSDVDVGQAYHLPPPVMASDPQALAIHFFCPPQIY